jgi:hypothetical protein
MLVTISVSAEVCCCLDSARILDRTEEKYFFVLIKFKLIADARVSFHLRARQDTSGAIWSLGEQSCEKGLFVLSLRNKIPIQQRDALAT